MRKITGYRIVGGKVVDMNNKKVKDSNGDPAPKDVIQALREAGVASFSCCRGVDWDVVKADAESLLKQLEVATQSK